MTIPVFGNIMPIHGDVLSLIGWHLSLDEVRLIESEPERLAEMRRGHAALVRTTDQDFGYDLVKWRSFLVDHEDQFGYRHLFAFSSVDQAVEAAIADPEFARLASLAAKITDETRSKLGT